MIEIYFLQVNKIENGRCAELDNKLTELATIGKIISAIPYAMPLQGKPQIGGNGELRMGPVQIVHSLVVILEKENQ